MEDASQPDTWRRCLMFQVGSPAPVSDRCPVVGLAMPNFSRIRAANFSTDARRSAHARNLIALIVLRV